jgi:nucleotide-binding universal stress UspA family protein
MYDDILVPTDGSESVAQALDHAFVLADRFDATIHTLYVVQADGIATALDETEFENVFDRLDDAGQQAVEGVRERAREADHEVETAVRRGTPAAEIDGYVTDQGVDLVVMATEGRTGNAREMLGSVTEGVVRSSSVPVLTVNVGE